MVVALAMQESAFKAMGKIPLEKCDNCYKHGVSADKDSDANE
jgi:hypothetical protein